MNHSATSSPVKNIGAHRSKLSLGPKNPQHKTYRRNENAINRALCSQISQRRIDIKAKELYEAAGVTSPTFYLHYHNPRDALANYEQKIAQDFQARASLISNKQTFYIILTQLISNNYSYFTAVARGNDHHPLKQVLSSYRDVLGGRGISDHNFEAYIGVSIFLINYWITQGNTKASLTDFCAERLASVRPIRWW